MQMESVDTVVRANLRRLVSKNKGDLGYFISETIEKHMKRLELEGGQPSGTIEVNGEFLYDQTEAIKKSDLSVQAEDGLYVGRLRIVIDLKTEKGSLELHDDHTSSKPRRILEKTFRQYNARLGFEKKECINQKHL